MINNIKIHFKFIVETPTNPYEEIYIILVKLQEQLL